MCDQVRAQKQFDEAENMTEKLEAFASLVRSGNHEESAKAAFYDLASKHNLVLDKWFRIQASNMSDLESIRELAQHPDYKNESSANRVETIIDGVLSNIELFHTAEGYDFIFEQIERADIELGNPLVAAATAATAFDVYSQLTEEYQEMI